MRKTAKNLFTATALLGAGFGLVIASQEIESPHDFRPYMYFSMPFGAPKSDLKQNNFFYGLRIDHTMYGQVKGLAPVAQLALDRFGFAAATLNGVPFAYRQAVLAQTDGTTTNFTTVDWTLLAIGAIGIGYTIAEVVDQEDSDDVATGGGGGGGGTTSSGGYTEGAYSVDAFDNSVNESDDAIAEYQKWLESEPTADAQAPQ